MLRPTPLLRLVDAHPRIDDEGWLHFECPIHGEHPEWGQCDVAIPLVPLPRGWGVEHRDNFERITIRPSIKITSAASECYWHGFITAGSFVTCGDSR